MLLDPFIPNDPRYDQQWHLQLLGDLPTVWADYTGLGVTVGVYDDGVDLVHPDLDGNVDADLVPNLNAEKLPFQAVRRGDTHGTSVAGVIAAEANDEGVVGVAFDATLGGVNVIGFGAKRGIDAYKAAFYQMDLFDITNHSWGNDAQFVVTSDEAIINNRAWERTAEDGRDGLGTIHVKAVSNLMIHAQAEDIQTSRHMVQVSALDSQGLVSNYAARGSSLTVLAPTDDDRRSITTTDRVGPPGDTNGDYTSIFGGTSSATPTVSGTIALMLEANPNLGWRDVQEILSLSATHTGANPGDAPTGNSVFQAQFNGAETWNGGGFHVSEDYGFGAVHALNAVRMAEAWSLFDQPATSLNEIIIRGPGEQGMDLSIPDNGQTLVVPLVTKGVENFHLEHVGVELDVTHTRLSQLTVNLVSPAGSVINLISPELAGFNRRDYNNSAKDGLEWTVPVTLLRGEEVNGTWQLELTDAMRGKTGKIDDFGLTFYGGTGSTDTVYSYTDEVLWALDLNADRRTLFDAEGTDWLNLAALSGDVNLSLAQGAEVDGIEFIRFAEGTKIENAVGGNGDDFLSGDGAANALFGMRGDDTALGRDGNDTLTGALGEDTLSGGRGLDFLRGGAEADVLRGGKGADTLKGGAGADRIFDGAGADVVTGGRGKDVFVFIPDGTEDRITDFQAGGDQIRLSGIDMDTVTFSDGDPGRVRVFYGDDVLVVEDGGVGLLSSADLGLFA